MNYSKLKNRMQYHFMLLPGVILTFIFSYLPLYGVIIAFQNYNPAMGFNSPWVGWQHFRYIFSQPLFIRTIRNTLYISSFKLILGIIVPVTVSILLNELTSNKLKRFYQTIVYIPNFLSWVILAGLFLDLLSNDGAINMLLESIGLNNINFLGDRNIFPWTMIFTDTWKNFGFGTVIYLAALTNISPELYESADIDGASRWEKIYNITIPQLVPTIILMTILSIGSVLNAGFDQIFNLYSPIVYETGDIIDTYVYRLGLENAQYSIAAAVGLFKSLVSFILVGVSYIVADKVAGYRVI